LKAGKELEAKYPGCDYTSNCEKRCQIESCGPKPGAPGNWVCENGKWVNKLEFFVSPSGNDENEGTKEKPFRTIEKAKSVVRNLLLAGVSSDIYIILREGSYFLNTPLVFDDRDSGKNGYKVVYTNYPGEEARVIGGSRITNWVKNSDNIYKAYVGNKKFSVLFENGQRAVPAREPNSGYFRVYRASSDKKTTEFYYDDRIVREPFEYRNAQVYLWNDGDWFADLAPIVNVDFTNNLITLYRGEGYTYEITEGDRYFIQHSFDFLDAPGEFYLDEGSGTLYYYPRKIPITEQEIIIPEIESLLILKGSSQSKPVKNLEFDGLTFMVTDAFRLAPDDWERNSALIYLENVENITIRNSRIQSSGSNGILLYGFARNNLISGNLVEHTGSAGIWLRGPDPGKGKEEADVNSNNKIINNYVRYVGELIGSKPGILLKYSGGNLVSNNKVAHTPYSGIVLSGMICSVVRGWVPNASCGEREDPNNYRHFIRTRGNVIQFNEVTDVMRDSQDGGGIYTWATAEDNLITNNLVHNFESPLPNGLAMGIYIDDAGDYTTISNNIIYGITGTRAIPVVLKGIYNKFNNNIVINNASPNFQVLSHHVHMWAFNGIPNHHLVLENNIFVYQGSSSAFRQLYRFNDWSENKIIFSDKNLFWHPSGIYNVYIKGRGELSLNQWRSQYGFDRNSLTEDPRFNDIMQHDYTVNNRNILSLGFKNIDKSKIGLSSDSKFRNKEEGRLQLLLKNSGFEETIPDQGDNGKTFDPAIWGVAEGKTEKGTANVIEEWPGLIQVVSKENGVLPYEGNKMLKIDAMLYVKTNVRQYYNQTISEGKLVQEIALYPFSNEYLQQIEIRGTRDEGRTGYKTGEEEGVRGNQLFSLKYSHLGMLLVVTTGKETKNGRHIIWKEFPALPQNQWSKIKIVLEKAEPGRDEIGEFSQFKLSLYVNDKLLYQSGRPDEPYIQFFSSADFVVIGDDYVLPEGKSPDKDEIMGPTTGDSFGIIYYDLANAWKE